VTFSSFVSSTTRAMSPHTASALFWYLRNSLFFSQGLEDRPDIVPLSYEDLASDPRKTMLHVCRFLGAEFGKI